MGVFKTHPYILVRILTFKFTQNWYLLNTQHSKTVFGCLMPSNILQNLITVLIHVITFQFRPNWHSLLPISHWIIDFLLSSIDQTFGLSQPTDLTNNFLSCVFCNMVRYTDCMIHLLSVYLYIGIWINFSKF